MAASNKDLPTPMQDRSRETADRFVRAATELLKDKTFAELSVAELARKAGRSVGVFYQRFGSKEDFLSVLLTAFFARARALRENRPIEGNVKAIYLGGLREGYENILDNRNLWHAALERSASDPTFWAPYHTRRERWSDVTRKRMEAVLGRLFTPEENRRLALAAQVFNSVINNQIINAPGPLKLEDEEFFPELSRIVLDIVRLPE